jgi:uncharacterized membrane-anchored protein YhcB (DUF1043 family)
MGLFDVFLTELYSSYRKHKRHNKKYCENLLREIEQLEPDVCLSTRFSGNGNEDKAKNELDTYVRDLKKSLGQKAGLVKFTVYREPDYGNFYAYLLEIKRNY